MERFYLDEDWTLKRLMKHMTQQGFHASKAQYLQQFKTWNLSKNISAGEWKHISRKVKARSRLGKTSLVAVRDRTIPQEKVRKETSRYDLPSYFPQSPSPGPVEWISVYTPREASVSLEETPGNP